MNGLIRFQRFPIIWFPEEERGLVTASHAVFRYEDKVTALRRLKNAYEQLYDGLVPLDFNEEAWHTARASIPHFPETGRGDRDDEGN